VYKRQECREEYQSGYLEDETRVPGRQGMSRKWESWLATGKPDSLK
jgi:hypothetical protein